MEAVGRLSRICGTPTPLWLRSMMIKLYQQMDEIRVHAEKKCRKFLTSAAEYSPALQHWYDRIHAYMDLLKLKQGTHKYMNKGNVRRNAKRRYIKHPACLTVEEIQDALRYCRIRANDLRKQAKSLRKAHLRNCLITAQEKGTKNEQDAPSRRWTEKRTSRCGPTSNMS